MCHSCFEIFSKALREELAKKEELEKKEKLAKKGEEAKKEKKGRSMNKILVFAFAAVAMGGSFMGAQAKRASRSPQGNSTCGEHPEGRLHRHRRSFRF